MTKFDPSGKKTSRTLRTVWLSCDILDALWELNGATVEELSAHLDLSESAIYNHLTTLKQRELVASEDDEYRLSLRFVLMGAHALEETPLYVHGNSEIEDLADRTGETAHLVTEQHNRRIELHTVSPDERSERFRTAYGTTYFHTTASGKAILAFVDESRRRSLLDRHRLGRRTANTITDEEELLAELDETRERGFAVNDEEEMQGLRAVGVPIRSADNTVLGSLSISGPSARLTGDRFWSGLPEEAMTTANMIELNLNKADGTSDVR